jgi:hypothetical protein
LQFTKNLFQFRDYFKVFGATCRALNFDQTFEVKAPAVTVVMR